MIKLITADVHDNDNNSQSKESNVMIPIQLNIIMSIARTDPKDRETRKRLGQRFRAKHLEWGRESNDHDHHHILCRKLLNKLCV